MRMERPQNIRNAQVSGNIEALSRMGRKGGLASAEEKQKRKERKDTLLELQKEAQAKAERERLHATNEDVLTPDGEDPNTLEN